MLVGARVRSEGVARVWARVLSTLAVALVASGCTIKDRCGEWEFEQKPGRSDFDEKLRLGRAREDVVASFSVKCCTCAEVRFIQLTRRLLLRRGVLVKRESPAPERETPTGFTVDQKAGFPRVYYCTGADGATAGAFGHPGWNGQPAELGDSPNAAYGDGLSRRFEFVTYAVCVRGEGECAHKILGALFWTFTVGPDGTLSDVSHRVANDPQRRLLGEAIDAWNRQAAASPPTGPGHMEPAPSFHD